MNDEILGLEVMELERIGAPPNAEPLDDEPYAEVSLGQILEALVPLHCDSEALDEVLGILESSPALRDLVPARPAKAAPRSAR
jgi:hypothetical protein